MIRTSTSFSFRIPVIVFSIRFCSAKPTSSRLRDELLALFAAPSSISASPPPPPPPPLPSRKSIAISDLASQLSDDALDELESSLKDWIDTNASDLLHVQQASADGKFYVSLRNNPQQVSPQQKKKQQQPQQNPTSRVQLAQNLDDILHAPAPPPPAVENLNMPRGDMLARLRKEQAWEQRSRAKQQEREEEEKSKFLKDSTLTDCDVEALQQFHVPGSCRRVSSHGATQEENRATPGSRGAGAASPQQLEPQQQHHPLSLTAAAFSTPQRLAFSCCPAFVVPLCHETLDLLELRIVEHDSIASIGSGVPVAEFFVAHSDFIRSFSPFERLQFLLGKQDLVSSSSDSSSSKAGNYEPAPNRLRLPFLGMDANAIDLVKLEAFAPTRELVAKWCMEEPNAPRVDALAPQKMVGLRDAKQLEPQITDLEQSDLVEHASAATSAVDAVSRDDDGDDGGGGDGGGAVEEEAENTTAATAGTAAGSSSAAEVAAAAAAAADRRAKLVAPEDFEPPEPARIAAHAEEADGNKYRYFFRLAPPFVSEKQRTSVLLYKDQALREEFEEREKRRQQQPSSTTTEEAITSSLARGSVPPPPASTQQQQKGEQEGEPLLPLGDDVFVPFQAPEYDAFRLARCLPANNVAISIKRLVVGGVLNLLSVPDIQLIITSFPEMFEFPARLDERPLQKQGQPQQQQQVQKKEQTKPEDLGVRFVLAGAYDKMPTRTAAVVRSEMDEITEAVRTRIDPQTGKKMKGGTYIRKRNKLQTLRKELALALHPGPHPFKDARVLAQLMFDLLPVNDCCPLTHIHHNLKQTEVQVGPSLNSAFFKKFPHLFKIVPLGTSESKGVIRADSDAEVFAIYERRPASEEALLADLCTTYRKYKRQQENFYISDEVGGEAPAAAAAAATQSRARAHIMNVGALIVKLEPQSRWKLEDMLFPGISSTVKPSTLGEAMTKHYSGLFEVVKVQVSARDELCVVLNEKSPFVPKR